jgi:cell division protein FtsL
MSENKLVDKLVAGFNRVYQEMETRISGLDSEIKKLESENDELVKKIKDWQESYDNYSRIRNGAAYGSLQYEMADIAMKKLSPEITNMENRHNTLLKEYANFGAERDSLSKKLGSLSSLSTEAKGETYYHWLVEDFDAAKSETEYTVLAKKFSDISEYKDCATLAEKCKERAKKVYYEWLIGRLNFAKSEKEYTELANKFSDISGYKDCAALAVKCKELAEEAKRTVQMQADIAKLNTEYNTKLKPLDDAIAALKKKLPNFKKTLTISSIVGAVIGCILFFAVTDYPDKGEFAGVLGFWLGSGVVALFCFGWKSGGCLAWLSAIVFVILTLVLVFGGEFNEFWLMTGIWLLYLLGGAIVSVLLCYLYKNNKKRIIQQEIANLENQKSALRSEYEKKKEEIRKNYQSL